jgi:hypothetical protein
VYSTKDFRKSSSKVAARMSRLIANSKVFDRHVETRRSFDALAIAINSGFAQDALEIVGFSVGLSLS